MTRELLCAALLCSFIAIVHGDCENYTSFQYHPESINNPCRRTCVEGERMTCRFYFKIETYYSMSKACYNCPSNLTDCLRKDCIHLDGFSKMLYTVNRHIPGPTVEVCEGDQVIVTIENGMHDETTSIHWHGMLQEGTPYYDGVPQVTQCPIAPGTRFEVNFTAVDTGTHYWHGHTGVQRVDGLFGAILVKQPKKKTIHADLYDYDQNLLIIHDWSHTNGNEKLMTAFHKGGGNGADTILCNGQGSYYNGSTRVTHTPMYRVDVVHGKRYRIRVIHAGSFDCPIEIYIHNHSLTVIATDGNEIKPVTVEALVIYAGERFDFILKANQKVDNYWICLTGLGFSSRAKAHTVVPLHYEGASCKEPTAPVGYNIHPKPDLILNALNVAQNESGCINIPELRSYRGYTEEDKKTMLKEEPDFRIVLPFDFEPLNSPIMHKKGSYGFNDVNSSMRTYTPQVNHVSFQLPNAPLLSQSCDINPECYCDRLKDVDCVNEYCECTVIHKIPKGAVVEVVLIDCGVTFNASHPFHLHGYTFGVIAMDRLGISTSAEDVYKLDMSGKLPRNLDNPPLKDTVTVPDGGYTVLRMLANNPGYWLFHCHLEIHFELKMAVVIKVGEEKHFPPMPYGFPRCGDFLNKKKRNCAIPKHYFLHELAFLNEDY